MALLERMFAHSSRLSLDAQMFLCPLLVSLRHPPCLIRKNASTYNSRQSHMKNTLAHSSLSSLPLQPQILNLTVTCPGCGAFSQTVNPTQPGYYDIERKAVKAYINQSVYRLEESAEREIYRQGLERADLSLPQTSGFNDEAILMTGSLDALTPLLFY